jgi:GT2 family glycosyltransferase
MEEDSSIGICGATVTYLDAPEKVQTLAGGRFQPALGRCHPIGFGTTLNETIDRDVVEAQLAYVNGAAAFVRRGYVEQIGLMREDYFLYFEEFDWAIRGRGKFRLGYAPDAVVLHEVGASIGTDDFGNASPLSTYYLTRNRLKFLWRFAPASLPGAIADTMLEAARAARQGRWDYVRTVVCASTGLPFRALAQ